MSKYPFPHFSNIFCRAAFAADFVYSSASFWDVFSFISWLRGLWTGLWVIPCVENCPPIGLRDKPLGLWSILGIWLEVSSIYPTTINMVTHISEWWPLSQTFQQLVTYHKNLLPTTYQFTPSGQQQTNQWNEVCEYGSHRNVTNIEVRFHIPLLLQQTTFTYANKAEPAVIGWTSAQFDAWGQDMCVKVKHFPSVITYLATICTWIETIAM